MSSSCAHGWSFLCFGLWLDFACIELGVMGRVSLVRHCRIIVPNNSRGIPLIYITIRVFWLQYAQVRWAWHCWKVNRLTGCMAVAGKLHLSSCAWCESGRASHPRSCICMRTLATILKANKYIFYNVITIHSINWFLEWFRGIVPRQCHMYAWNTTTSIMHVREAPILSHSYQIHKHVELDHCPAWKW